MMVSQQTITRADALEDMAAGWLSAPARPNSLVNAFSYFDLDINNPKHGTLLLIMLADAHFGRDPKRRPKG